MDPVVQSQSPSRITLTVHVDGRWFVDPQGNTVDLGRTRVMRRVVSTLAHRRRTAPGLPLTTFEVFHAGWPDEQARPSSIKARVHMLMLRLRGLGLAGILVNRGAGYYLAPEVDVDFDDGPAPAREMAARHVSSWL